MEPGNHVSCLNVRLSDYSKKKKQFFRRNNFLQFEAFEDKAGVDNKSRPNDLKIASKQSFLSSILNDSI